MERPQRHRRGVNHYSDDNPSTFTVKRRRGSEGFVVDEDGVLPEINAAERRAARAEGRRQRSYSKPRDIRHLTNHHHHVNVNSTTTTTTTTTTGMVKRGPGRPPNPHKRKRRLTKKNDTSSTGTGNNSTTHSNNGERINQSQHETNELKESLSSSTTTPLQTDEIIAHSVTIQPVLPLTFPDKPTLAQRYPQFYQKNHHIRSQTPPFPPAAASGLATQNWTRIVEAHQERWVPLQQPGTSSSNNNNGSREEQSLLALPAAPWTCFAVRKDDPLYFGVGDAAGNLLLYNSQPPAVCIQTVVTFAAKREAERPILWSQTAQKGVISYPNAVGAVCWHRHICVVWTRQEVEIFDVVQHTTLACLPLNQVAASNTSQPNNNNNNNGTNGSVKRLAFSCQSLDLHPTQSFLLWRPLKFRLTTAQDTGDEDAVSLYYINFADGPAGIKRTAVAPRNQNGALKQSADFFFHAAVWDNQRQDEISSVMSQPQENDPSSFVASLCRMTVDGQVSQITVLPESGSVSGRLSTIYTDCVLEQYDDYLFLCTGRGIRCYETRRLTFLTVYGETVALHNKTVGWQGCFWIPEPSFEPSELVISSGGGGGTGFSSKNRQSCWIHREDEFMRCDQVRKHHQQQRKQEQKHQQHDPKNLLRQESNSSAQSGTSTTNGHASLPFSSGHCPSKGNKLFANMLLVGVPHPTRGPTELQSTLYVWKPGQVLPLTTLQAPPGGLLGLHIHSTPTTGWRLTCATAKLGQGWQLSATFKSDFAGTMYPVGYQILNDNIEYLEEEGELDQVIVLPHNTQQQHLDDSPQRNKEESDLQRALKQSLVTAVEDKVSVLLDEDEQDDLDRVLVPSVPDPSLREDFEEGHTTSPKSPNRRIRSTPQALTFFPQYNACKERYVEQDEEQAKRRLQVPQASFTGETAAAQQAMKLKGKRSRMATVEAMLQAAVDPALKYKMGMLHKEWSNLGGSRFLLRNNTDVVDSSHLHPASLKLIDNSSSDQCTFPPEVNQSNAIKNPPPMSINTTTTETETSSSEQYLTEDNGEQKIVAAAAEKQKTLFCAACHGRMVVHVCGKRELPVDTEALERAEKARKEQEEAEQKRQRAERRRLAEAKRRENRRKKKEIEERRLYVERMEAERRLRAKEEEEEQERKEAVARELVRCREQERERRQQQQQLQQQQTEPQPQQRSTLIGEYGGYQLPPSLATKTRPSIPKFSELRTTNGYNNNNNNKTSAAHSYSSAAHGFYATKPVVAPETYASAAATTNSSDGHLSSSASRSSATPAVAITGWASGAGSDSSLYQTCQSHDTNANAAGASVSAVPARRELLTTTFTASDGDALAALVGLAGSMPKARTTSSTKPEVQYDYSGSSDRRTAILAQYASLFQQLDPCSSKLSIPSSTTTTTTACENPAISAVPSSSGHTTAAAAATTTTTTTFGDKAPATTTYKNGDQQIWAERIHHNTAAELVSDATTSVWTTTTPPTANRSIGLNNTTNSQN